jgi:hypothetical protein
VLGVADLHFYKIKVFVSAVEDRFGVVEDIEETFLEIVVFASTGVVLFTVAVEVCSHPLRVVVAGPSQ